MARLGRAGQRPLYGRLGRPDGDRFARARRAPAGLRAAPTSTTLCHRLVAYFDKGTPLSAAEVRSATFRRRNGRNGYAEAPVDAFFARAVEVLLGVE